MANDIDLSRPVAALRRAVRVANRVTRVAVTRSMTGLAALVATSLVSGGDLTDARPRPGPVLPFSERFGFEIPAPTGQAVDLTATRRDVAAIVARFRQDAPGVRPEALDGAPPQRPGRYVTVERRTRPTTSELVRYQVTDIASD